VLGDVAPVNFLRTGPRVLFPTEPVILGTHTGRIDLVYVGDDNKLKHSRRHHDTVARPTNELPQPPTTIGSVAATGAANQIDAVALGADRSLYYFRYAGGSWRGFVGFGANIISNPAIVDTGAGQLEIFAIDSTFKVRRWRLWGGQLRPGEVVPTAFDVSPVLFGAGSAHSSGDGNVDLVVARKGDGRLHHSRLAPGLPGPINPANPSSASSFVDIGMSTADQPVLVAAARNDARLLFLDAAGRLNSGHFFEYTFGPHLLPETAVLPGHPASFTNPLPSGAATLTPETVHRAAWRSFTVVDAGPTHVASAVELMADELLVPLCSRNGNMSVLRFSEGRWLPRTPVFGNLPTLPDDRPSRIVATRY
jgi:hypothetical protein